MNRIETTDCWPELIALKDELSLRELAERFAVSPGAISSALKRTNIHRKTGSRRAAPPRSPGRSAWRLITGDGEAEARVIVAESLSAAAARACAQYRRVLGLEWIGEVI